RGRRPRARRSPGVDAESRPRRRAECRWLASCPRRSRSANVCTESAELLLDPFVAAVEMVDATDLCGVVGGETREDQRDARPQIRRHDGSARQSYDAAHHGIVALDRNVRAETHELERVHEAVLEDRLGD